MAKKHALSVDRRPIDTAIVRAEQICAERGLRFTPLRREVLTHVWASPRPIKAYAILDAFRMGSVSAYPPTVYRALDFLSANGMIHKLASINAYFGCAHPLAHLVCYVLLCEYCGNCEEHCSDVLNSTVMQMAQKKNFHLRGTTLEIVGFCQTCHEAGHA